MPKLPLQASGAAIRRISPWPRLRILAPVFLYAFARSRLAYSTSDSTPPAPYPDPWKEWIKPNKRAQARQEIYGACWADTRTRKDRHFEKHLSDKRERFKARMQQRLGDEYEAFVEERRKQLLGAYASVEWREEIERHKKQILEADEARRRDGSLKINVPTPEPLEAGGSDVASVSEEGSSCLELPELGRDSQTRAGE